jgi:hypothetical protein
MGTPFILTVLSEDGYQVFAALYREYDTLERAIEGAKADYLKRYGGNPAFRVYHAEGPGDASGYRHTLIEVCFDESKRRSFVALYKVLQELEPDSTPLGRRRLAIQACSRILGRLFGPLRHLFPGPGGSGTVLVLR